MAIDGKAGPPTGPGDEWNIAKETAGGIDWQAIVGKLVDEAGATYGVKHVANKPRVSAMPYTYDIGEGNIADHTGIVKYGANGAVSTTEEIVASQGDVLLYPSSAAVLRIYSASSDDDLTGTGAQTVDIFGLDGSYVEQTETVDLDGAGAGFATTSGSYLRVFRMEVNQTGSGEENAGLIQVRNVGNTETYLQIDAGLGRTLAAQWTVPADMTLFIAQMDFSSAATKGSIFRLFVRKFGGVFQVMYVTAVFASTQVVPFPVLYKIDAKSDVQIRAEAITAGDNVTATLHGWYES